MTAGSLKVAESRIIADLLLWKVDEEGWIEAILTQNVLQAPYAATAIRLARLIRGRLMLRGVDLWKLVRDGTSTEASHAL
jgi:hypothetical protein